MGEGGGGELYILYNYLYNIYISLRILANYILAIYIFWQIFQNLHFGSDSKISDFGYLGQYIYEKFGQILKYWPKTWANYYVFGQYILEFAQFLLLFWPKFKLFGNNFTKLLYIWVIDLAQNRELEGFGPKIYIYNQNLAKNYRIFWPIL